MDEGQGCWGVVDEGVCVRDLLKDSRRASCPKNGPGCVEIEGLHKLGKLLHALKYDLGLCSNLVLNPSFMQSLQILGPLSSGPLTKA